jgi:dihydrofolate reductase
MKVILLASLSADGLIAETGNQSGSSTHWTSKEDTKFFVEKTKEAGIVVMGSTTYLTIPEKYRPLIDRVNIIYTSKPDSIPHSQPLPPTFNLLPTTTPYTTTLPPQKLIDELRATSYELLAIIGGSSIYTQFLQANVIDTLLLTYEPILFGAGTMLFDKPLNTKLQLSQIHKLSDQVVVHEYQIIK